MLYYNIIHVYIIKSLCNLSLIKEVLHLSNTSFNIST